MKLKSFYSCSKFLIRLLTSTLGATVGPANPARHQVQDNIPLMEAVLNELIEPSGNPNNGLCDLDLSNRPCTSRITTGQEISSVEVLAERVVAVPLVGVASPGEGTRDGRSGVAAGRHLRLGDEELVGFEAVDEVLKVRVNAVAAECCDVGEGVDDAPVPDGMEVCLNAAEDDGMVVSTTSLASDMHRLSNVLSEVGDELDSIGALCVSCVPAAKLGVLDAALEGLGLIGEGRDDTAVSSAIPVQVEVAELWRIIGAVDPMPGGGVTTLWLSTMLVRPCSDATKAALSFRLKNAADDLLGFWREELFRRIADLVMNYKSRN